MNPRLLIIVASDPRSSARPAEAVRIAAGVGAWQKVDTALYLRGPAVLALGEDTEMLVDGESFGHYLPLVAEPGGRLFVERGTSELAEVGGSQFQFEAIDATGLARLAAGSKAVLRF